MINIGMRTYKLALVALSVSTMLTANATIALAAAQDDTSQRPNIHCPDPSTEATLLLV
jgi:hypothetical protein